MILKLKKIVSIQVLNLLTRSASKSNFWQCFHCVIKGNVIDFELEKQNVKVLNSLLGFPKHKSPLIIKTTWGVYYVGGRLVLGGRDYIYILVYTSTNLSRKKYIFWVTRLSWAKADLLWFLWLRGQRDVPRIRHDSRPTWIGGAKWRLNNMNILPLVYYSMI